MGVSSHHSILTIRWCLHLSQTEAPSSGPISSHTSPPAPSASATRVVTTLEHRRHAPIVDLLEGDSVCLLGFISQTSNPHDRLLHILHIFAQGVTSSVVPLYVKYHPACHDSCSTPPFFLLKHLSLSKILYHNLYLNWVQLMDLLSALFITIH